MCCILIVVERQKTTNQMFTVFPHLSFGTTCGGIKYYYDATVMDRVDNKCFTSQIIVRQPLYVILTCCMSTCIVLCLSIKHFRSGLSDKGAVLFCFL